MEQKEWCANCVAVLQKMDCTGLDCCETGKRLTNFFLNPATSQIDCLCRYISNSVFDAKQINIISSDNNFNKQTFESIHGVYKNICCLLLVLPTLISQITNSTIPKIA